MLPPAGNICIQPLFNCWKRQVACLGVFGLCNRKIFHDFRAEKTCQHILHSKSRFRSPNRAALYLDRGPPCSALILGSNSPRAVLGHCPTPTATSLLFFGAIRLLKHHRHGTYLSHHPVATCARCIALPCRASHAPTTRRPHNKQPGS